MRNFNSTDNFEFFGPNLPKKLFPVENRKIEHHGILHIRISLGTEFQLTPDNFEFLNQIYPKKLFPVENRTSSSRTTSVCFLCGKS